MKNRLHPLVRITWATALLLAGCKLKTEDKTSSVELQAYLNRPTPIPTHTLNAPNLPDAYNTAQVEHTLEALLQQGIDPYITPQP